MMYLFWAFAILLVFLLIFVIAVRNKLMAWGWNFALIAIILYAGLFKMTGTARDAWLFSTIESVHGDVEVVYATVIQKKFIYLLVQASPSDPPYYLRIEYRKDLEDELDKAKMEAERRQTVMLADADALSRWIMHVGKKQDQPESDGKGASRAERSAEGQAAKTTKGDIPPQGGEPTFYPKPVEPNPLKDYRSTIIEMSPVPTTNGNQFEDR
jgi:hypothetical protein